MDNLESLDSSSLQDLIGGGEVNLIPEALITTITVGFIALNVLGVLFVIVYIIGMIRKWKVQSAVLDMQKDVAEIKAQLTNQTPKANTPPVPSEKDRTIAQVDTDDAAQLSANRHDTSGESS